MISKFKENPRLNYFLLYSFTLIFYGAIIASPGPIIPFLSAKHSIPETSFTFFFSCRSIGFIVGAVFIKIISGRISSHTVISISVVLAGFPFILFPYTDSLNLQGGYIFFSSLFCSCFEILVNMCVVQSHRGNNEDFWLQLGHGLFGVGGLMGPIFIGYLKGV